MKKKTAIIITVLMAAALVLVLIFAEHRQKRQEERLAQLKQEAAGYEQEVTQLRRDLEQRSDPVDEKSDGSVIPAFVPRAAEDMDAIAQLAEGRSFTPLIMLDCSLEQDLLEELAETAAGQGYDLCLSGITFDEKVLKTADAIKEKLPALGFGTDIVFMVRKGLDTTENLELLYSHGYDRLILYSSGLVSGLTEQNAPYVTYGFTRTTDDVLNFLELVTEKKSSTVMIYDFKNTDGSNIQASDIDAGLTLVENKIESGNVEYAGLDEALEAVVNAQQQYEARVQENEKYKAETQQHIDELESLISDIYSRWDEEN